MARYVTEFIGTFFLVLTIALCVLGQADLAPLAIGCALMVMVYMGGPISGAHYNPAVTLAIWIRGKIKAVDVAAYVIAQLLGATAAAAAAKAMMGDTFAPAPGPEVSPAIALVAEILFTFALALVVLNVATAPKAQGNSYYGAAIGFTVLAGAVAAGPISGGVFNPAVGIGPIVIDAASGGSSLGNLWLYIVGPVIGGAAAAGVYRLQHAGESE